MIPVHAGLSLSDVERLMVCPCCGRADPRCGDTLAMAPGVEVRVCNWISEPIRYEWSSFWASLAEQAKEDLRQFREAFS